MTITGSLRSWPALLALTPLAAAIAAAPVRPGSGAVAPVKIGAPAGSLAFRDVSGKSYTTADLRGQPAMLFVFLSTQCPVSNSYASRLQALQKEYAGRGVRIFGVN